MAGPQLGKDALLDAAVVLFDEHGVDAVSLGQINRASGHRNRSAANYHFGNKEAVIRAVLTRSMIEPNRRRHQLLDELEAADPNPSVRAVAEVMVAPLTEALERPEGRRHLRLLGQIVGHPRYFTATQNLATSTSSLGRCAAHFAASLRELPSDLRIERVALMSAFVVRAYSDQAHLVDAAEPARPVLPTSRFRANVLDLAVGALFAPSTT